MYNSGTEILSELLEKFKLNERTFQRIFKKYVGVTPNQYRRICQFHISFAQLEQKILISCLMLLMIMVLPIKAILSVRSKSSHRSRPTTI